MDINRNNYETFFLLCLDKELGPAEMKQVEIFLIENADLQKEFYNLQQTILMPGDMVFERKETLLRVKEKRRIVPLYWVRIAAAIVVLITGSWFVITLVKNNSGKISGKEGISFTNPLSSDKRVVSTNTLTKNKDIQPAANRITGNSNQGETAVQNNTIKAVVVTNAGRKNKNDLKFTNKQLQSELQNILLVGVPEAEVVDLQKSNPAVNLQSTGPVKDMDSNQIRPSSDMKAPALLIAENNSNEQIKDENEHLKETDFQSDNAISVIALNDRNKAITGFFKKLTKRAPEDETTKNTRKLRVSVFQISY